MGERAVGGRGRRWAGGAVAVAVATGLVAAGCGGGSSGGTGGGGTTPPMNGTVTGNATKGPVAGATVTAFAITNGARGLPLGAAQTDAQGRFAIQVGTYAGAVLVELRGGSYTDEATGSTMAMGVADVMTSAVPDLAAGSSAAIEVTPLTSMAQSLAQGMPGGMTAQNVTAANADVGSYFSAGDILHTAPMDPLVPGSGATATQDARNYGMTLAAMSQYAGKLGMTTSSGMVSLMMADASDGVMNGMVGSTAISMGGMGGMTGGATMPPASGTTGLATAMTQFVGSSMNRSGVTPSEMQPLVDKLQGASGALR